MTHSDYWDNHHSNQEPQECSLEPDELIRETKKTILYRFKKKEIWIPKAVHEIFDDGTIVVNQWFAEKEGLI